MQLDVPLREPLVPKDSAVVGLAASEIQESLSRAPKEPAELGRSSGEISSEAVEVDLAKRTLAIVGEVTDRAWGRQIMDQLADVPTMAEPIAPDAPEIPVHSGAAAMFTTDAVAHGEYSAVTRPEQIVVVGRPTLHRPVAKLLADPNIRVVVVTCLLYTSPSPRDRG